MEASILTKGQKQKFTKQIDSKRSIEVTIRYDDECGNGHNSFSMTGTTYDQSIRGQDKSEGSGCIHEEIIKYFPEFSHLIKWHLMSSDEPMHYVANSLYHASNRDCHGLLKGEKRQLINGKTKLPSWHLVAIDSEGNEVETYEMPRSIDSEEKPDCKYTLDFRPWCRVGEGKEPDLKAARSSAIWPEATLEDFTKEKLMARLPKLVEDFRKDIEALGFIY